MTFKSALKAALFSLLALGAVSGTANAQADAPLLSKVPPGTVLTIGDPETQKALELSGLDKELTFKVNWANISGGPQTSEAFRAKALDVGAVAEIPSIFANWNNLPVRNIAYSEHRDPIANPIYRFGIAPGVIVKSLADFRGKRIAFSPGQAQGTLVLRALRAASLQKGDVTLIELPSTSDVYPKALASRQVDIAPLGGVNIRRYINQYGPEGASLLEHGLRDDPAHLYAPQWVLDDPAKAAALAEYVGLWARAIEWVNQNPETWIKEYYVGQQGLSREDGEYLVHLEGEQIVPADWSEVKKRHQDTINLLAQELGYEPYSVEQIFDNRFEKLGAAALAKSQ
ncbi:ABC transporter substrate-binding protein [Mesorhizobium sp. VK4C]|uniref:ABC transporter substrate-binding protein n=1 Tax=Mesorhizobium captivum TaxID=3072319 RepID=UPI002A249BD9|nr:ABC transporter substrate-binding protein [Mesorhizobium sp. VK4C]MDX8498980.1 ABC transporter substrate-binding protein [Mesorhizobium sp. VK4C]